MIYYGGCGRYDIKSIKAFIDEFNPDIIFCPHLFSIKSRRIERIIHSISRLLLLVILRHPLGLFLIIHYFGLGVYVFSLCMGGM